MARELEDPIFRQLESWFDSEGISIETSRLTVGWIQSYCDDITDEVLKSPTSFGLSCKKGEYGISHVWLTLLWPTPLSLDSLEQSTQMNQCVRMFAEQIGIPLSDLNPPTPSLYLEFMSPDNLSGVLFEDWLQEASLRDEATYVGVLTTKWRGLKSPNVVHSPLTSEELRTSIAKRTLRLGRDMEENGRHVQIGIPNLMVDY